MDKETLSMTQAGNIINTANEILGRSNGKMNDAFSKFLEDLSKVWEDNHAVELAEVVNNAYQDILANLTSNNQVFANTIIEIANSYKKVGGMQEGISTGACGFGGMLNMGQVTNHFSNTENADDFGFLDINSSPSIVMDSLKTLQNEMKRISTEIVDAIKRIPAFGNSNVKLEIAKSSGKIVEIIEEGVKDVSKSTEEKITEAAKAYGAAGAAAIGAISGIADLGDKISDYLHDTTPQAKYAPPSQPNITTPITVPEIPPQVKYAPPSQPDITTPIIIEAPPVQTKYAPPPQSPPINVEIPKKGK